MKLQYCKFSNTSRIMVILIIVILSIMMGIGYAEEPVDLVDPLIDSANSRWFFFSSACRPFGMVNLSPDNQQQNRRTFINYGNQPCMHMAFLFNYSGAPWLSQYWSRQIVETVYSDVSPYKGYSGDEDQGFMGSLSVLMKMGLFEMRGGAGINPIYEIGSPIFDKITLHLDSRYYPGETFIIETINNDKNHPFIQSATLNDRTLETPWFSHKELVAGGKLVLELGAQPNKRWGSAPQHAPPSMSDEN